MRNANYFTKFWQLSLIMAESVRVRWQNGEKPRLNDNLLFFSGKLSFFAVFEEKICIFDYFFVPLRALRL